MSTNTNVLGGTSSQTTSGTAVPATSTNTTTHTTTTTGGTAGSSAGQEVKGLFAKGHGIGEAIRGNINSAIDGLTGDSESLAKNESVAKGGEQEFQTGQFVKKGTTDKAL